MDTSNYNIEKVLNVYLRDLRIESLNNNELAILIMIRECCEVIKKDYKTEFNEICNFILHNNVKSCYDINDVKNIIIETINSDFRPSVILASISLLSIIIKKKKSEHEVVNDDLALNELINTFSSYQKDIISFVEKNKKIDEQNDFIFSIINFFVMIGSIIITYYLLKIIGRIRWK
ncbi:LSDV017 [Lumpy skin disease virus]|nr:LSDV017 [Lumpy skin disease virus]